MLICKQEYSTVPGRERGRAEAILREERRILEEDESPINLLPFHVRHLRTGRLHYECHAW